MEIRCQSSQVRDLYRHLGISPFADNLSYHNIYLAINGLLVLKVPYPWILGFLSGLFDVMPMIGPGAVFCL